MSVSTDPTSTDPTAPRAARRGLALPRQELRATILPVSGLILLVVLFGFAADNFFTAPTVYTVLREASVVLVVSIGMTYVVLMGSIDLSVGATVTLSGLVAARVAENYTWGTAVAAGVLAGACIGVVNGAIFAYAKVPSFLTTLGTSLAISGLALWYVGGRPVQVSDPSFLGIAQSTWFGNIPNIALWSFLLWGIFSLLGLHTRFGRYTYAIGGGEAVSHLAGIPVRRYKFQAMVLCGTLAGVAGILLTARVGAATPAMGDRLTLMAIAAVVMGGTALTGGVGGVYRTILGVLVITVLSVGLNALVVPPYMQQIIQGSVVVLAVALTLDRSKLAILK
jgi:ribose transport system permease protein/putative xylitol transport system permease protein